MTFQIITAVAAFFGALTGGITGLVRLIDWIESRSERRKRVEIRYAGDGWELLGKTGSVIFYADLWLCNASNGPRQLTGCSIEFGASARMSKADALSAEQEDLLRELWPAAPADLLLVPFVLSAWEQRRGAVCFLLKAAEAASAGIMRRGERKLIVSDNLGQVVVLRF